MPIASIRSSLRPRARPIVRAIWATSSVWVSRVRTVVAGWPDEDLGLVHQPAEALGVDDPVPIALECRPQRRAGPREPRRMRFAAPGGEGRKQELPHGRTGSVQDAAVIRSTSICARLAISRLVPTRSNVTTTSWSLRRSRTSSGPGLRRTWDETPSGRPYRSAPAPVPGHGVPQSVRPVTVLVTCDRERAPAPRLRAVPARRSYEPAPDTRVTLFGCARRESTSRNRDGTPD